MKVCADREGTGQEADSMEGQGGSGEEGAPRDLVNALETWPGLQHQLKGESQMQRVQRLRSPHGGLLAQGGGPNPTASG